MYYSLAGSGSRTLLHLVSWVAMQQSATEPQRLIRSMLSDWQLLSKTSNETLKQKKVINLPFNK